MRLLDVNVLVNAHREDAPDHVDHHNWLAEALAGGEPIGITTQVLAGFVRVVTHRRVFDPPTPLPVALEFASRLRAHPGCVPIEPGRRHWEVFAGLCQQSDARGNLITDAQLAATAIESGCELVSSDRDFARFPGLRWRRPLD
ncbi:type II toxin-antitoxin system VapC family toxin [Solicola gregarius]|uniref:Ribonuclease VapC n=1 Tax=Solicola gregarius TaxID=2908642 RepID=A0AA46TG16_9ACTN|nr:type II toxin-antitoxin system VapC family toxin [Solicola gregarius]UYM04189.1 type II toxin-antitoxin system VapC family toxin [Solicola gregarius]